MKLVKKIALLLMILTIPLCMTSCKKYDIENIGTISIIDDEIENYPDVIAEVEYASDFLPALSDLSDYTNIRYSYRKRYYSLLFFLPMFVSEDVTLFVEYPDDIYEDKKTQVLDSYEFLEATIISEDGKNYQSAPATFEYGEYDFRTTALPDSLNSMVYMTKSFAFIGVNDDKNRIAFCYFYDIDLDTMGSTEQSEQEMITEFIDDYFDWNDLP